MSRRFTTRGFAQHPTAKSSLPRRASDRCLVTMDLEFGNPLVYKAADYRGIAILRVPSGSSADHLERVARTLVGELKPSIARHLWIVEIGRIRIYEDPDEDPLEPGEFDR